MFETKLIETSVLGRTRGLIDRRVALGKRDDSRQIIDERQKFTESPDPATVKIIMLGAALVEGAFEFVRSRGEIEIVSDIEQFAAIRAGVNTLVNGVSLSAIGFDALKVCCRLVQNG